jgi:hypothetical protein
LSPAPKAFASSTHAAVAHGGVNIEIYVTAHCPICTYAYEIAALIRQEFPAVHLRLIDLSDPQRDPDIVIPESVFATPTYLLNGERWSLGNPAPEHVRQTLLAYMKG